MIQSLHIVEDYSADKVNAAVAAIFEEQNVVADIRPGMKVVIKPNFIMAKNPEYPAVTNPAVIKAAVIWLKNHGVDNITLAESPGGPYNAEYMKHVYRTVGAECVEPDCKLNDDFTSKVVFTEKEDFKIKSFNIITPIAEADYIINICKLKTHAMTGYSGGIKNLFGTIPGLEKPQMHYRFPDLEDFSNMLLELAQTVKPDLTIIDAINAMEGDGPTGGDAHPLHMVLGARDFYTQDYFAAGLMKIDPKEIVMIRQAVEKGLAKPDEIELVGDDVPEGLTPFKRPATKDLDFANSVPRFIRKPFVAIATRMLKSYPKLDASKCVGCGKCAESCPAHIIVIEDKKAKFRKKDCISCFCCQEMCPMKAIYVKKAL